MVEESSSAASSATIRTASLIVRIFSFALLFIALIVLATNTITLTDANDNKTKIHFNDFHTYRYMLSTIVIGAAYSLVQLVLSLVNVVSANDMIVFSFFGDKLMSYFLATGSAAGFGLTVDLHALTGSQGVGKFYEQAYATSSLLLLAFICVAALSLISAFALPRKSQ